jgi:hypothetical protein
MEEYVNKEDLLVLINAEIEFAKLVGNFSRVTALSWALAAIKTLPTLEVIKEKQQNEPILYRHTEERE